MFFQVCLLSTSTNLLNLREGQADTVNTKFSPLSSDSLVQGNGIIIASVLCVRNGKLKGEIQKRIDIYCFFSSRTTYVSFDATIIACLRHSLALVDGRFRFRGWLCHGSSICLAWVYLWSILGLVLIHLVFGCTLV